MPFTAIVYCWVGPSAFGFADTQKILFHYPILSFWCQRWVANHAVPISSFACAPIGQCWALHPLCAQLIHTYHSLPNAVSVCQLVAMFGPPPLLVPLSLTTILMLGVAGCHISMCAKILFARPTQCVGAMLVVGYLSQFGEFPPVACHISNTG